MCDIFLIDSSLSLMRRCRSTSMSAGLPGPWNRQLLSDRRVDCLVALWLALPNYDKQRLIYPARQGGEDGSGAVQGTEGEGVPDSLQCCLLGLNSSPANWPAIFCLVEAICSHLCQIHPSTTQSAGVKSRRALILADYVAIRVAVLNSPRLMAQTNLQLFELNQRTISQWYSRCQKEMMVLQQGLGLVPAPSVNAQPLPAAKPLHYQREGIQAPFPFPTLPPPRSHARPPSKDGPPILPAHLEQQPPALPGPSQALPAQGPPTGSSLPPLVPRTMAWRRGQLGRDEGNTSSTSAPNAGCRSGGRRGTAAFCSVAEEGKTVAQWLAEMKDAKGRGDGH
ncbi:uncharacterized protein LOC120043343 [Salvelinus namaycush]|uniref:Uncharacterized protein LOC120043343 n=1 Tax=Salvelinus namaycush TaxID=8040 RepID=A0A8U0QHN7_SALNM|nr:uncharacterized protein LOC120043343 [Salvelinus namaycush]